MTLTKHFISVDALAYILTKFAHRVIGKLQSYNYVVALRLIADVAAKQVTLDNILLTFDDIFFFRKCLKYIHARYNQNC